MLLQKKEILKLPNFETEQEAKEYCEENNIRLLGGYYNDSEYIVTKAEFLTE